MQRPWAYDLATAHFQDTTIIRLTVMYCILLMCQTRQAHLHDSLVGVILLTGSVIAKGAKTQLLQHSYQWYVSPIGNSVMMLHIRKLAFQQCVTSWLHKAL